MSALHRSVVQADALRSFHLQSFGTIQVPTGLIRVGFQIDLSPPPPHGEILFGLLATRCMRPEDTHGFLIRIDFERGEIWDAGNDTGLLGWIDSDAPSASVHAGGEPLLLSFELEKNGQALIPTLRVGREEWLYPSLCLSEGTLLSAVAGGDADNQHTYGFQHSAFWHEEPV